MTAKGCLFVMFMFMLSPFMTIFLWQTYNPWVAIIVMPMLFSLSFELFKDRRTSYYFVSNVNKYHSMKKKGIFSAEEYNDKIEALIDKIADLGTQEPFDDFLKDISILLRSRKIKQNHLQLIKVKVGNR